MEDKKYFNDKINYYIQNVFEDLKIKYDLKPSKYSAISSAIDLVYECAFLEYNDDGAYLSQELSKIVRFLTVDITKDLYTGLWLLLVADINYSVNIIAIFSQIIEEILKTI